MQFCKVSSLLDDEVQVALKAYISQELFSFLHLFVQMDDPICSAEEITIARAGNDG